MNIPAYFQLSSQLGQGDENELVFNESQFLYHEDNKYHYYEKGEGKETLIFLHGIMVNSTIWKRHIDHFSKKYKVYAVDFLGHGLSSKKENLNLQDLIEQIRIFIQKKKLKNPVLVGHSLGGLVASIYGTLYPETVSRLILISCGEYDSVTNNIFAQMNSRLFDLFAPLMNQYNFPIFLQMLGDRVYNYSVNLMDSEFIYHFKLKGSKQSIFSLMKNTSIPDFSVSQYANINCPVLVIHGEKDRMVEIWHGEKLASLIPGSEMVKISGGSHMIIEENEIHVRFLIEDFVENAEKASKTK